MVLYPHRIQTNQTTSPVGYHIEGNCIDIKMYFNMFRFMST